jgi:hypothetical protein
VGIWAPLAPSAAATNYATMSDKEALRVVLSPVQLAAVLQGEQISAHEIMMNRLWGGAKFIGGALELVGGKCRT